MTLPMIVCLPLVLLINGVCGPDVGAAQTPGRAADLTHGSVERRLDALVQILEVPPERRDPQLLTAIRLEATRMLAYYRGPRPGNDQEREVNSAYAAGLARALGESRDPVVIPLLIEYAGFGRYATDGLVRFGDLAVPALLRSARGTKNDLRQVSGAVLTLGYMLEVPPDVTSSVSATSREEIAALAQELLVSKLTFGNVIGVSVLALATGRADLRQELERLATDSDPWIRRGLIDPVGIRRCQGAIQAQLKLRSKQ